MHEIRTPGLYGHRKRVCTESELTLGEKSLDLRWNQTCDSIAPGFSARRSVHWTVPPLNATPFLNLSGRVWQLPQKRRRKGHVAGLAQGLSAAVESCCV